MHVAEFKNLYSFFDYIEFCPLCKSRTLPTVVFTSTCMPELTNKHLKLTNLDTHEYYGIDLFSNEILPDSSWNITDPTKLMFGRQCTKYHFNYSGSCDILMDNKLITNIRLEKYHFIRIMPNTTHFAINNSFTDNTTSVRITANYKTREIMLQLVEFNFSSKKKIDQKLRNIQLLG